MSLKIKLIIDTIPEKSMEGYVDNLDGYGLRDKLCEAIIKYEGEENREEIENRFYDTKEEFEKQLAKIEGKEKIE